MRPVALGRKNWIHIGSPQAGQKVAAILSVVESCRRLQVPVRDYFSTILPGLADLPIRCLPTLLPLRGSPGIPRVCGGADALGNPRGKDGELRSFRSMTGPARCCLLVRSKSIVDSDNVS